ncbi:hypothetical protein SDC9_137097 [bioreactor metagenome]|uniref:Uncharacterized protein n=1 Tax=bioreactor metagenome TaxID=1076179 RepID=A0A645DL55_9ZZZZ
MLNDFIKQRCQVGSRLIGRQRRRAVAAGAVDNGGVKLFVCGVEVEQQLQNLLLHLAGSGVRPVNLVDDQDDLMPELQCFLQHKASLRHRTFEGIHQQ